MIVQKMDVIAGNIAVLVRLTDSVCFSYLFWFSCGCVSVSDVCESPT